MTARSEKKKNVWLGITGSKERKVLDLDAFDWLWWCY